MCNMRYKSVPQKLLLTNFYLIYYTASNIYVNTKHKDGYSISIMSYNLYRLNLWNKIFSTHNFMIYKLMVLNLSTVV